jgi:Xaa-Pro aminopeptidase
MLVSLPPVNVARREARAQAAVAATNTDAMIVTGLSNIRWLTGFAGSNATVLLTDDRITLFTDSRYADRAPRELAEADSSAEIVIARADLGARVAERLDGASSVALEAEYVTWMQQRDIAGRWLPLLREQPTERAFAAALEAQIRTNGGAAHSVETDLGFDTIVASGPNGAIPHHAPVDRVIETGDLVIVDVGGRVDGYRSDMTRTFCVGSLTADQSRHYDTVIAAQQAGVEAMVVGAETNAVDRAARSVIADAGWADSFTHGTGHGVGLDIHELPRVASTSGAADVYEAGTVATVEPGVYLRGLAGVRIEDTCVATMNGAERLTSFPKDPEI